MFSLSQRLVGLLAMLWVGSQLTIGYVVAPVLFASLDRTTAGSLAAKLFHIEGWSGLGLGVVVLVLCNVLVAQHANGYRRLRWLVAGMLVCVLVGYFGLQPFMNSLRIAAMQAGTDVGNSPYAQRFMMLHGASSIIYLIESALGIVLVWLLAVPRKS